MLGCDDLVPERRSSGVAERRREKGQSRVPLDFKQTMNLQRNTEACYVCGPANPMGLHIRFEPDGEGGSRAQYTARKEHCGWPGLLHGGVAFAMMDEALAYALYFQKLFGVTARAETRFRQPISEGMKLTIRATTVERKRRLITARAEIRTDDTSRTLLADTEATMYIQQSDEGTAPAAK